MQAKPQLGHSRVRAGFRQAACCVQDGPPDGSTEFPGSRGSGILAPRPESAPRLSPGRFLSVWWRGGKRSLTHGGEGRGLGQRRHQVTTVRFSCLLSSEKPEKKNKTCFCDAFVLCQANVLKILVSKILSGPSLLWNKDGII